jgi:hypothetical protein
MRIKRVQFGAYVSLVGNDPKTVWEVGKDGIEAIVLGDDGMLFFYGPEGLMNGTPLVVAWPPPGTLAWPREEPQVTEHEEKRAATGDSPAQKQAGKARR